MLSLSKRIHFAVYISLFKSDFLIINMVRISFAIRSLSPLHAAVCVGQPNIPQMPLVFFGIYTLTHVLILVQGVYGASRTALGFRIYFDVNG